MRLSQFEGGVRPGVSPNVAEPVVVWCEARVIPKVRLEASCSVM